MAAELETVRLRVNSRSAPENFGGRAAEFGLQDKKKNLRAGEPNGNGLIRFDLELPVYQHDSGRPRFRGPFVHNGAKGAQHLYVGWRYAGEAAWINRLKVHLDISWEDIRLAIDSNRCLMADGTAPEWGVLKDWHGLNVGREWLLLS